MMLELLADNSVGSEIGAPLVSDSLEGGITAVDDLFSVSEDLSLDGNLLSDNGNGTDNSADGGNVKVIEVNGSADNINQDFTLASGSVLTVGSQGQFQFAPNGQYQSLAVGATATETFTYTIQNEQGETSSATAIITIQGENDAPIVQQALEISINEDAEDVVFVSLIAESIDPDDDVLGASDLTLVSGDDSGVVQIVDNLFIDPSAYRALEPGESEVLKYEYNIVDGLGGETPQNATIVINGTSTGPEVVTPLPDQQVNAYTPFSFEIPVDKFFSAENSPLELSAGLADEQSLPDWLSFDPSTNQLSGYATVANRGKLNIEITATDTEGDFEQTTFNLGIALPLNQATNRIEGDPSANRLDGTNANDVLRGKAGSDTLRGLNSDDNIYGGSSKDLLYGNRGNDVLHGGNGHDTLRAGNDDDLLVGGNHNDQLNGGTGNDTLDGGSGNDTLWGSKGNDVFILNQGGEDVITAGGGYDSFVLTAGAGQSLIRDFKDGEDSFVLTQGISVDDLTITLDDHGNTNIAYKQGLFNVTLRNVENLSAESFQRQ